MGRDTRGSQCYREMYSHPHSAGDVASGQRGLASATCTCSIGRGFSAGAGSHTRTLVSHWDILLSSLCYRKKKKEIVSVLWQISVTLLQSPFSLRGVCPLKIWGALSWRCPILASICTLRLRRGIVGETIAVGKMSGNSFNICFFQPFVSAKTCVIWELSEHKRSDKQRLYFGEECMAWKPGRFAEMLFQSLLIKTKQKPKRRFPSKKMPTQSVFSKLMLLLVIACGCKMYPKNHLQITYDCGTLPQIYQRKRQMNFIF